MMAICADPGATGRPRASTGRILRLRPRSLLGVTWAPLGPDYALAQEHLLGRIAGQREPDPVGVARLGVTTDAAQQLGPGCVPRCV
jgi:hypothetical protein